MDNMEMVDRLREKTDLSYEEAKALLEEANWDLLDAMVLAEKRGRTRSFKEESWQEKSSSYQKEARENGKKKGNHMGAKAAVKKFFGILTHNSLRVVMNEKTVMVMPAWVFAILLLFSWKLLVPLMIVGLFFGMKYFFEGRDNLDKANEFMDKASDIADEMKSGFEA